MFQWQQRYTPMAGLGSIAPNLSVSDSITVGRLLAATLVADQGYADRYLRFVKEFFLFPAQNRTSDFAALIASAIPKAAGSVDASLLNEHDCANIHRAAWLLVLRALARLVAFHPFRSQRNRNPYADPLVGGSERHVEMSTKRGIFLFQIPNGVGQYALTNADIEAEEKVLMGPLLDEDDIAITVGTKAKAGRH